MSLETAPGSTAFDSKSTITLRVLPTMTVRIFKMKVSKSFKISRHQTSIKLWLKMQDGTFAAMDNDEHDLDWWGLDHSSEIYVYFEAS